MYNLSQGYGSGNGGAPSQVYFRSESRLESIAHSEVSSPQPAYSAVSARSFLSNSSSAPSYAPPTPPRISISYGNGDLGNGIFSYSISSSSSPGNGGYGLSHGGGSGSSSYNSSSGQYSLQIVQPEYHFDPALFLRPGKEGGFVGKAEEVREFVETAFEKIFQASFPNDIKISILPAEEFRKLAPQPGVIGLSLNRKKEGLLNEVFILNDSLARVMLTIGHELGHVLTETLANPHDEEAKAYAFSLEWMSIIKKNDIAGLGDAFVTERPAENGLHNVAFSFVEKMLLAGKQAWNVYLELIKGFLMVRPQLDI